MVYILRLQCTYIYTHTYIYILFHTLKRRFLGDSNGKESARSDGDLSSIPGKSLGNDNPLQYSCLENPMDGGAWQATACRVTKSQTRLSIFTHSYFKEFESESINYFFLITKKMGNERTLLLSLQNEKPDGGLLCGSHPEG